MLAITLVQILCAVCAVYFGAKVAMALGRDVRHGLFSRVQRFSDREVNQFGTPTLITRTTNDVQQVQMLAIMTFTLLLSAPIMCIGGIILALHQDVKLSSLLIIAVPLLGIILTLIISRMRPLFKVMQERLDNINRVLREQITGVRVIRAFVRDPQERDRFEGASSELFGVQLGAGKLMALMFPSVMLVLNLSTVAVVWFGGHLIGDGSLQIGSLTAFITYLAQILMSVMMATFMFMLVPRAEVSADRIMEVLDTAPALHPAQTPLPAGDEPGKLELRGVEFRYPGAEAPVLHDVSLTALPGQTTAIIGGTGSGKTTLINLIPRLIDVTGGSLLVGGVDVRDLDPAVLSAVGRPDSAEAVPVLRHGGDQPALRQPAGDRRGSVEGTRDRPGPRFVARMPDGLNARIAQGGTNVSGGQRQRLAIARALVHQPQIYVFDDSFSALDYATDARLRAALATEVTGATMIIVAQRVSTIRQADQILVLDAGRIVAAGTHDELMDSSETYREIVLSQLTEQEAAA